MLEDYVEYYKHDFQGLNITLLQDTTVGKENAVRSEAKVPYANFRILQYLVLHNDKAYYLQYVANNQDYDKFLPEFEALVESFRFNE